MEKQLSVAGGVRLVRRYVKAQDPARRQRVADQLSGELLALAKQGVVIQLSVDILLAGEQPDEEQTEALVNLTLDPDVLGHLSWISIRDQWNATLAQRVIMYSKHFEPVEAWFNEWPNIEEHMELMQLGEDTPDVDMLRMGFHQVSQGLGFQLPPPRHRSSGRPTTDEVIDWRIEAVEGWLQQWPEIEPRIYLLMPEMAPEVVSTLGGVLATIPATLHAATEYYRLRRDSAAKYHRILMETTINPPTA
jgi:hypothetical protein